MNKSSESIQLKRITGSLKINGIEAAFIDQTIKQVIRPGNNNVELNFEVFLPSLQTLFENRFKAQFMFKGTVEAEGLTLPIIYSYEV